MKKHKRERGREKNATPPLRATAFLSRKSPSSISLSPSCCQVAVKPMQHESRSRNEKNKV